MSSAGRSTEASRPRGSVLVVSFNCGSALTRCVRSVLDARGEWEVVVVDNHSSDGSVDALRDALANDARVKISVNPENRGFATAVNQAAARSSASTLVLLNPDAAVHPDSLERLLDALEAHPRAGLAGGLVFDGCGREQRGCRRHEPTPGRALARVLRPRARPPAGGFDRIGEPLPGSVVEVDAVSGSFLALGRELFDELGGLDAGYFLHCEDLDLCRRVRDAGRGVLFVPTAAVVHIGGVSGAGRPVRVEWHKHRGMLRYYLKHHRSPGQRLLLPAVAAGVLGRFLLVALSVALRAAPRDGSVRKTPLPLGRESRVVVLGATSVAAPALLSRLESTSHRPLALSRRPERDPHRRLVSVEYLEKAPASHWPPLAAVVSLAPIWVLPDYLPALARRGARRVVALSTTSVVTKSGSSDAYERDVVARVEQGERALRDFAAREGMQVTILRTTMIYDGERDRSVARMCRLVRRVGVFPLVRPATGLRQPLHAGDLAGACVEILARPATFGRCYEIGGGEQLSYEAMVRRVFRAVGRSPRILAVPASVLRVVIRMVSWLPGGRELRPGLVDRMQRDLCFSNAEAARDFDFAPRPFQPA